MNQVRFCRSSRRGLYLGMLLMMVPGAYSPIIMAASHAVTQNESASNASARQAQAQAEQLDEAAQKFFAEYRQLRHETLQVEAYNQRLDRWVQGLRDEVADVQRQISSLESTRRALLPMLSEMVERMEQLIRTDLPFHEDERLARVAQLRQLLDRVDVSQAEKLRQVLASYRRELDFGRTLETWDEQLNIQGQARQVEMLRVGRIGLYYLDNQGQGGVWSSDSQQWQPLEGAALHELRQGVAMAKEQGVPRLLTLPLSVAPTEKPAPKQDAVDQESQS